jgi:hypothetical protein
MEISNLFKWNTVHFVEDENGDKIREDGEPVKVFVRIVGDNDLSSARHYAIKKARKLRKEYKENAEDYIPDLDELSKEELVSIIILGEMSEIYKQAERDTEIKFPKKPDGLTLQDEERYQKERDDYFDNLQEAILNKSEEYIENRKKYYNTLSKENLKSHTTNAYINKMVENEMSKIYNDAILYYACFVDDKFEKKVFDSIEDVINASSILKSQLQNTYNKLSIKDTELKK